MYRRVVTGLNTNLGLMAGFRIFRSNRVGKLGYESMVYIGTMRDWNVLNPTDLFEAICPETVCCRTL